jgi:poly-gamma-glutamate synthesis protein (capsule biosynthesis protein)
LVPAALIGCRDRGDSFEKIDAAQSPVSTAPASSVTLALLGDIMLGREIHPTADTFAYLEPALSSADLALANLESPLTDSPVESKSSYALCAPPRNVKFLAASGINLLSLANNHNLDCGAQGLAETEKALGEAGLGFIGPGPEPVYRTVNGIPLAFLAIDATSDRFEPGAAIQAVRSARKTGAVVVVSIHWGVEYQSGPSNDQQQIAQELATAGAALIWGHHPHVLQPSAWLADGRTLVLYSLGNALFDQNGLESTRQAALVLVTLNAEGTVEFKASPFLIDVRGSRVMEAGEQESHRIMQNFKQ